MDKNIGLIVAFAVAALILVPNMAGAQDGPGMSFFVTSSGPGDGANLGGLDGADAHCQMLAAAAGAGNRSGPAYNRTSWARCEASRRGKTRRPKAARLT